MDLSFETSTCIYQNREVDEPQKEIKTRFSPYLLDGKGWNHNERVIVSANYIRFAYQDRLNSTYQLLIDLGVPLGATCVLSGQVLLDRMIEDFERAVRNEGRFLHPAGLQTSQ